MNTGSQSLSVINDNSVASCIKKLATVIVDVSSGCCNGDEDTPTPTDQQHNSLSGLQGGSPTERYHLTKFQYDSLVTLGSPTLQKVTEQGATTDVGIIVTSATDSSAQLALTSNAIYRVADVADLTIAGVNTDSTAGFAITGNETLTSFLSLKPLSINSGDTSILSGSNPTSRPNIKVKDRGVYMGWDGTSIINGQLGLDTISMYSSTNVGLTASNNSGTAFIGGQANVSNTTRMSVGATAGHGTSAIYVQQLTSTESGSKGVTVWLNDSLGSAEQSKFHIHATRPNSETNLTDLVFKINKVNAAGNGYDEVFHVMLNGRTKGSAAVLSDEFVTLGQAQGLIPAAGTLQSVTNGTGNNITSNAIQGTGSDNVDLTITGWALFAADPNTTVLANVHNGSVGEQLSLQPEDGGTPGFIFTGRISIVDALNDNEAATLGQLNTKQNIITLTTTGSSGVATFDGTTLNIPQYAGGGPASDLQQVLTAGNEADKAIHLKSNTENRPNSAFLVNRGLWIDAKNYDGGISSRIELIHPRANPDGENEVDSGDSVFMDMSVNDSTNPGSAIEFTVGVGTFSMYNPNTNPGSDFGARFSHRVKGLDGTEIDDFVTKAQLDGAAGVSTMTPIGAEPNAEGGTMTGTVLTLQPASELFGGVVTTDDQVFSGEKTFKGQFEVIVEDFVAPATDYRSNIFVSRYAINIKNYDASEEPDSRGIEIDDTSVEISANSTRVTLDTTGVTINKLVGTGNRFVVADENGLLGADINLTSYYQRSLTLTTTGTSGPATLIAGVLNIPQYSGGGGSTPTLQAVLDEGNRALNQPMFLGDFYTDETNKQGVEITAATGNTDINNWYGPYISSQLKLKASGVDIAYYGSLNEPGSDVMIQMYNDGGGDGIMDLQASSMVRVLGKLDVQTNAEIHGQVNAVTGVFSSTDDNYTVMIDNGLTGGSNSGGLYVNSIGGAGDTPFKVARNSVEAFIVRGDGTVNAAGNMTAANLSGTNTGDQDLSGYAPLASPGFTGTVTASGDVVLTDTGTLQVGSGSTTSSWLYAGSLDLFDAAGDEMFLSGKSIKWTLTGGANDAELRVNPAHSGSQVYTLPLVGGTLLTSDSLSTALEGYIDNLTDTYTDTAKVNHIVTCTQDEWDDLYAGPGLDANTFYIIITPPAP